MKKLGSIEADQQARLAHMLTRKGGKEITKALSDGALLRCHLCIGVVSNDRHLVVLRVTGDTVGRRPDFTGPNSPASHGS